jgi:hypothetical protein
MAPHTALVIVGSAVDHTSGIEALASALNESIDGKGRGLSMDVLRGAFASMRVDPDANIGALVAWGMIIVSPDGARFHLGPIGRAIATGFYIQGNQ